MNPLLSIKAGIHDAIAGTLSLPAPFQSIQASVTVPGKKDNGIACGPALLTSSDPAGGRGAIGTYFPTAPKTFCSSPLVCAIGFSRMSFSSAAIILNNSSRALSVT